MTTFAKREALFSKYDDEHRIAYGWAIVSEDGGKPYFDLQGDHIPMSAIIPASIDFMKNSRASDDMHREVKTGDVVYCAPVTKGTVVDPEHPGRTGLWIGVQINDDDVYQKTKTGKRSGFSIGGFLDEADYIGKNGEAYTRGSRRNAHTGKRDASYLKAFMETDRDYLAKREQWERMEKGSRGRAPERVFRSFRLGFISTVDLPAQEGALISVVKGAPREALLWLRKGVVLTSEEDGHQHVLDPSCFDEKGRGCTSGAQMPTKDGYGGWHTHDMVRDEDGNITIAANAGHGHTADVKAVDAAPTNAVEGVETVTASKSAPDSSSVYVPGDMGAKKPKGKKTDTTDGDDDAETADDMKSEGKSGGTKNPKKALVPGTETALQGNNKETRKMDTIEIKKSEHDELIAKAARLDRAEKIAELTDVQKAFFGKLGAEGQKTFLAKSSMERDAEITSQIDFTAKDGTVYYKFTDPTIRSLAKRADVAETAAETDKNIAKRATFAKKAGEILKGCPGSDDVHTDLVAAIETFYIGEGADVKKTAAYAAITALREGFITKSVHHGHNGVKKNGAAEGGADNGGSELEKAQANLNEKVADFAKRNNIPNDPVAFAQATAVDPASREAYEIVMDLRD